MTAETGFCVFWSELVGEKIAFIRHDRLRYLCPEVVCYSLAELRALDRQNPNDAARRLIHEAKKQGGIIK